MHCDATFKTKKIGSKAVSKEIELQANYITHSFYPSFEVINGLDWMFHVVIISCFAIFRSQENVSL